MAGLEIGVVPSGVDERCIDVSELSLRVLRKGRGPALVYLHDSLGNIGWLPLFDDLASDFDVVVPDLPGFGGSECPQWARSTRDIAILVAQLLARLELDDVTLVGTGFGGWIAAEIATMDPRLVRRLVLVGAAGIKPRRGEIADQMLRGALRYGLGGFRDATSFRRVFAIDEEAVDDVPDALFQLWDLSTEMTARVCWKPWMFSLELPSLLAGITAPTAVVWGEDDQLFPLDIGHHYVERLPDARLHLVTDAGHWVELEQPEALAEIIRGLG
jgi:pimeloyl-ACP methyl ester carboxylesterase